MYWRGLLAAPIQVIADGTHFSIKAPTGLTTRSDKTGKYFP